MCRRLIRRIVGTVLLLPMSPLSAAAQADPAVMPVQPIPGLVEAPPPTDFSSRRARFLATIAEQARQNGVAPALADAVATVESAYDPGALGENGEVGLMQILPSTAAMLGFRGTNAALSEPETNIRYGVVYLAQAWTLANGNVCRTLMKYRAGHGEERMTPLSIAYCRRALEHLASVGSPLASGPGALIPSTGGWVGRCGETIPVVALTGPERVRLRRGQRSQADSLRFQEAQIARIRVLRACLARHSSGRQQVTQG